MSTEKQVRYIRYKFKVFVLMILSLYFMSCAKNYKSGNCIYNYTISIGNNISIDKAEADSAFLPVLRQNPDSRLSVEIVIFSFSSGKELFSYSEDKPGDILSSTQIGKIEALVKIKQDNNLVKVLFINATGNSKKDVLHKLAIASREALCDF